MLTDAIYVYRTDIVSVPSCTSLDDQHHNTGTSVGPWCIRVAVAYTYKRVASLFAA